MCRKYLKLSAETKMCGKWKCGSKNAREHQSLKTGSFQEREDFNWFEKQRRRMPTKSALVQPILNILKVFNLCQRYWQSFQNRRRLGDPSSKMYFISQKEQICLCSGQSMSFILILIQVNIMCIKQMIWTNIIKQMIWTNIWNCYKQIFKFKRTIRIISIHLYDFFYNWIFGGIWTVMLTRIARFFPNGPKLTTWELGSYNKLHSSFLEPSYQHHHRHFKFINQPSDVQFIKFALESSRMFLYQYG